LVTEDQLLQLKAYVKSLGAPAMGTGVLATAAAKARPAAR
jgi:O-acetyl-ADP-ribose deacetylase (regulator of RNase III)